MEDFCLYESCIQSAGGEIRQNVQLKNQIFTNHRISAKEENSFSWTYSYRVNIVLSKVKTLSIFTLLSLQLQVHLAIHDHGTCLHTEHSFFTLFAVCVEFVYY